MDLSRNVVPYDRGPIPVTIVFFPPFLHEFSSFLFEPVIENSVLDLERTKERQFSNGRKRCCTSTRENIFSSKSWNSFREVKS